MTKVAALSARSSTGGAGRRDEGSALLAVVRYHASPETVATCDGPRQGCIPPRLVLPDRRRLSRRWRRVLDRVVWTADDSSADAESASQVQHAERFPSAAGALRAGDWVAHCVPLPPQARHLTHCRPLLSLVPLTSSQLPPSPRQAPHR